MFFQWQKPREPSGFFLHAFGTEKTLSALPWRNAQHTRKILFLGKAGAHRSNEKKHNSIKSIQEDLLNTHSPLPWPLRVLGPWIPGSLWHRNTLKDRASCKGRSNSMKKQTGLGCTCGISAPTACPLEQDVIRGRKVVEGGPGDPETSVGGGGGVEAPCCRNTGPVTLWYRKTLKDGASSDGRSHCVNSRQDWAAHVAFLLWQCSSVRLACIPSGAVCDTWQETCRGQTRWS